MYISLYFYHQTSQKILERESTFYLILVNLTSSTRLEATGLKWRLPNLLIVAKVLITFLYKNIVQ
jgi:thiamine pyrophosphokinase